MDPFLEMILPEAAREKRVIKTPPFLVEKAGDRAHK